MAEIGTTTELGSAIFYVYVLFNPMTGQPCYVGKGKGNRDQGWRRKGAYSNASLKRIIKSAVHRGMEMPSVRMVDGVTEEHAFRVEMALISAIGRKCDGGPLVNLTTGGEGNAGTPRTKEHRAAMSRAGKGRKHSPEQIEKTRAGLKAYFGNLSDEQKAERAAKISAATRERMKVPGVSEKISRALTGRIHDAERRKLTSVTVRRAYAERPELAVQAGDHLRKFTKFSGHTHTAETRQKMSISQKATADRKRMNNG